MKRIFIDRKAIAENRERSRFGRSLLPPIILECDGSEEHVFGVVGPGWRVVYVPKKLNKDGSPVDPHSPEVWVQVDDPNVQSLSDLQQAVGVAEINIDGLSVSE